MRVLKFAIVGGINTAVSYLSFVLLTLLNVNYMVSSTCSYLIAVAVSYLLNKRWTFKSSKKTSPLLLSQFVMINLLSLGVNLIVLYLLVEKVSVNIYLAQAIAIIFSMIFNYVGYKWLFVLSGSIGSQKSKEPGGNCPLSRQ